MNMTGHIPGLLARSLDRVAVIGFGTGLTTGAIARYRETKSVDVVEISDTIIKDAHFFDKYNGGVSMNPKVHFNEMDAFRFLTGTHENFDVIISEPSNPWVAGVENLYSAEFYEIAKRKLNPDGVYFQWLQSYSFSDDLFRMVLKTITSHFRYVSVFQMMEHDCLLVASQKPLTRDDLLRGKARFESNSSANRSLQEVGINRFESMLALEIIPAQITPLLGEGYPQHRLETPRLSQGAARAFYVGTSASPHAMRREMKQYYPAIDSSLLSLYLEGRKPGSELVEEFRKTFCDNPEARSKSLCEETIVMAKWLNPTSSVDVAYSAVPQSDFRNLASFAPAPALKGFTEDDLLEAQRMFDVFKRYYSSIARIPSDPILSRLGECLKRIPAKTELYGDCLLQRAAVLEVVRPDAAEFRDSLASYSEWFAKISPDISGYQRFKDANEILERVFRKELDAHHPG